MARIAIAILTGLLVVAYIVRADAHGRQINTDFQAFDQASYYHFAEKIVKTGGAYLTDGARGPAFPWLLAPFVDIELEESDEITFFDFGKRLGIVLSLVCLGVVAILLFRGLPRLAAINVFLATAFTVFVFKAAYIQPELAYYTAFFAGFVLLGRLLVAPSARFGLAAGGVVGLAHLLKPSALPLLALYLPCAVLAALGARRAGAGAKPGRERWIGPILAAAAFAAIVAPYAVANKRTFGQSLYNVNSTFYMWYDDWADVTAGTKAFDDRKGWPDMPADQLPSASRYWREHSARQIVDRVASGLAEIAATSAASFGWAKYAAIYALLALAAVIGHRAEAIAAARRRLPVVLFIGMTFAAYLVLFAWFGPINYGPRFVLSLFLPFMFVAASIAARWSDRPTVTIAGRRVGWFDAAQAIILIGLAIEIAVILAGRIVAMPAGA